MVKHECKLKMKLDKVVETKQEKKTTFAYVFKPTLDSYSKHVTLKVTAEDPYELLGKLGLPESLGDTVIIGMSTKEEQKKLT